MKYNVYIQMNGNGWKKIKYRDINEVINDIMKSEENINCIITEKTDNTSKIIVSFNNRTGYEKVRRLVL